MAPEPRPSVPHIHRKKPHRKSRSGCANCKRRKVKCDEDRPSCQKCISFDIPCDFSGTINTIPDASTTSNGSPQPQRRSRGRPRKNWNQLLSAPARSSTNTSLETSVTPSSSLESSDAVDTPDTRRDHSVSPVGALPPPITANTELLLHYLSHTAMTLAGDRNNSIARFWMHNVPRIGLVHPFVMHLVYAVAGHHMLWLRRQYASSNPPPAIVGGPGLGMDIDRSLSLGHEAPELMYPDEHYTTLLEQHGNAGVAKLNEVLKNVNEENCGAAHLGTMIVCNWTFAAGPTGPDDLLVCHIDPPDGVMGESTWKHEQARAFPMIYGVRITRTAFPAEVTFRGLMAPMNTPSDEGEAEMKHDIRRAAWGKVGFVRINWSEQLHGLRKFLASPPTAISDIGKDIVLHTLDMLVKIYSANFGDDTDAPAYRTREEGHFDHILGWLYRLNDEYVVLVKRRESGALVVLAYFALLLRILRSTWWLDGWAEHLVKRAMDLVEENERGHEYNGGYGQWFDWVIEKMGIMDV